MKVDLVIKYAGQERVFENLEFTPPMLRLDLYDNVSEAILDDFHDNYDLMVLDSLSKEEL